MTTIRYKLTGARLTAVGICEKRTDAIKLVFDGIERGTLLLGGAHLRITLGEVTVPEEKLYDGKIFPTVITEKSLYSADGFEKTGRIVRLLPFSDASVRELYENHILLTERVDALEKLVKKLSDKIESTTIL